MPTLLHRLAHSQHSSCLLADQPRAAAGAGALGSGPADGARAAPGGARPGRRCGDPRRARADRARRTTRARWWSATPATRWRSSWWRRRCTSSSAARSATFLREETPIFDDIRAVLDQQLARLSALEQELLIWLAIEREATDGGRRCGPTWCRRRRRTVPGSAARAAAPLAAGAGGRWLHAAERGDRVPHRAAGGGRVRRAAATRSRRPSRRGDGEQRTLAERLRAAQPLTRWSRRRPRSMCARARRA